MDVWTGLPPSVFPDNLLAGFYEDGSTTRVARERDKAMKVNIRRTGPWLSLLMLLSLVLAACGGGSSSSQGPTLHVLIGYNSTYPTQQKQWMQEIASAFQKANGATLSRAPYTRRKQGQKKVKASTC